MLLKCWCGRCGIASRSASRRHHQRSSGVPIAGVEIASISRISQTRTGKWRDISSRSSRGSWSRNQVAILCAKYTIDLPSSQRVPLQGWLAGQGRELINPDQIPYEIRVRILITEGRTQRVLRVEVDVLVHDLGPRKVSLHGKTMA